MNCVTCAVDFFWLLESPDINVRVGMLLCLLVLDGGGSDWVTIRTRCPPWWPTRQPSYDRSVGSKSVCAAHNTTTSSPVLSHWAYAVGHVEDRVPAVTETTNRAVLLRLGTPWRHRRCPRHVMPCSQMSTSISWSRRRPSTTIVHSGNYLRSFSLMYEALRINWMILKVLYVWIIRTLSA